MQISEKEGFIFLCGVSFYCPMVKLDVAGALACYDCVSCRLCSVHWGALRTKECAVNPLTKMMTGRKTKVCKGVVVIGTAVLTLQM